MFFHLHYTVLGLTIIRKASRISRLTGTQVLRKRKNVNLFIQRLGRIFHITVVQDGETSHSEREEREEGRDATVSFSFLEVQHHTVIVVNGHILFVNTDDRELLRQSVKLTNSPQFSSVQAPGAPRANPRFTPKTLKKQKRKQKQKQQTIRYNYLCLFLNKTFKRVNKTEKHS